MMIKNSLYYVSIAGINIELLSLLYGYLNALVSSNITYSTVYHYVNKWDEHYLTLEVKLTDCDLKERLRLIEVLNLDKKIFYNCIENEYSFQDC